MKIYYRCACFFKSTITDYKIIVAQSIKIAFYKCLNLKDLHNMQYLTL